MALEYLILQDEFSAMHRQYRTPQAREFTFSLTYEAGGTEALVLTADSEDAAKAEIARRYPGAKLNWIL